jgi:glc operon protein GlcG
MSTPAPTATPPAYGPPITLREAKIVMAAAEAEALKNGWPMIIAIVDSGTNLVLLTRMENGQIGSLQIAQDKAQTAVRFKRQTKVFQDLVATGGGQLRLLAMNGLTPLEGGLPIFHQGKIIGGIGVSGMSSTQDQQVGEAGIAALAATT